jgi:glutamine synthetase
LPWRPSEQERKELGITELFPKDLKEALEALQKDKELITLLGSEFVTRYIDVKNAEMAFLEPMSLEERRRWILERY